MLNNDILFGGMGKSILKVSYVDESGKELMISDYFCCDIHLVIEIEAPEIEGYKPQTDKIKVMAKTVNEEVSIKYIKM